MSDLMLALLEQLQPEEEVSFVTLLKRVPEDELEIILMQMARFDMVQDRAPCNAA